MVAPMPDHDIHKDIEKLKKEEENRNETLRKSIESTNTLQDSLRTEIARVNDERVKKEQERLENMKLKWGEHERDIENHIRIICNNHVIEYIGQEDFPHPRNKPDNSIEIMDQLIVFDAKSPANDDLSNFPKYIKLQTENLKKFLSKLQVFFAKKMHYFSFNINLIRITSCF